MQPCKMYLNRENISVEAVVQMFKKTFYNGDFTILYNLVD